MAAFKFSMIFNYISGNSTVSRGNRAGGWSESVYQGTATAQRITSFQNLAQARSRCLPPNVGVVGIRVQQVDPSASAQTFNVNYPGPNIFARDIPQMALKFRLQGSGVTNVRNYSMASIPDDQVTDGEFNPTQGFRIVLRLYLQQLNNWQFRGTNLTTPPVNLLTIDATGNYVSSADVVAPLGTFVKIKSAVTAVGKKVSGRFQILKTVDLRNGQLKGWTAGACTLGTITPVAIIYPNISNADLSTPEIGVRKIGRPSKPYRGRRSKRRS